MKLQYLGDARDAFKWDLLNWICRRSVPAFRQLFFVPMLTPDIHTNNEGNVPHHRFDTPIFLQQFLTSLRTEPRTLARIKVLGRLEPDAPHFQVLLHGNDHHYLSAGNQRSEYWSGLKPEALDNSIIFFDPDNGFETQTRRSSKWIRHDELKAFLSKLPNSSVVMVYQHRPRKKWCDLFQELSRKLDYAHTTVAAFESNLAFVVLAKDQESGERITKSIRAYADSKIGNKVAFHEL